VKLETSSEGAAPAIKALGYRVAAVGSSMPRGFATSRQILDGPRCGEERSSDFHLWESGSMSLRRRANGIDDERQDAEIHGNDSKPAPGLAMARPCEPQMAEQSDDENAGET
jgi:hypothetical protein